MLEWEHVGTPDAMMDLGERWSHSLVAGDVALLFGPLGAGKSTLVRGVLRGLGYMGPVRSPSFNLLQSFRTRPPVLHADLYRLPTFEGLGIEDYLATHLCLIEWAERAEGLLPEESAWRVHIRLAGEGRDVLMVPPSSM